MLHMQHTNDKGESRGSVAQEGLKLPTHVSQKAQQRQWPAAMHCWMAQYGRVVWVGCCYSLPI